MLRIAVNGANGRMGNACVNLLSEKEQTALTRAYDRLDSSSLGQDIGLIAGGNKTGVILEASDTVSTNEFDVLIDFSSPDASIAMLEICAKDRKAMVIGVTGFSDSQEAKIAKLSQTIPVVHAPNMSLGVNLCLQLLKQTARVIGSDADIDIFDAHHRQKKDAPSGTALKMGHVIAQELGLALQSAIMFPAGKPEDIPRPKNRIGFQVVRSGDAVGEHTATFMLNDESIAITHRSFSRNAFARGAVEAAIWIYGKPAAQYGMDSVIGLDQSAS